MAKVDKNIVVYLQQLKTALRSHTDWVTGYAATDKAVDCVQAVVARQCSSADDKSNNYLLDGLVQFRADVEVALSKKFKTDADGLRNNSNIPEFVKYDLGVMDLLIGHLMFANNRAKIVSYKFHA
jgi:hypothetical protein